MSQVDYLVFDIETVGDGGLIQRLKYPDTDLSPAESVARFQAELLEQTGRDVLPPTFTLPVSVAVAKVSSDFQLIDLTVLDAPEFRPEEITRRFWQGWTHYERPCFVTFNGRSYDIPVMELAAFRYGISLPGWFNVESRTYEQARNRYNITRHIDLCDLFSNFGAMRMTGGLNLMANLIDKPGKSGVDGSQVQQMYFDGHLDEINDYCRCDVLDTYFVFLRSRVLLGRLTLEEEQELVLVARMFLEEQADDHPAYRHYLQHWTQRVEHRTSQQWPMVKSVSTGDVSQ